MRRPKTDPTSPPSTGGGSQNVLAVVDGLKEIAASMAIVAQEKTKQAKLEAAARLESQRIQSMRDVLMSYLDKSFDERKQNFETLFEKLDDAMATNNVEMVSAVLNHVVQLAESSPFKALKDAGVTRELLQSKSTEWEF